MLCCCASIKRKKWQKQQNFNYMRKRRWNCLRRDFLKYALNYSA